MLPAHHPLARLDAIPLAALAEEAWIWFPRTNHPQLSDELLALCQQAGFEPRVVQTANQPHTIVSLVEAGVGIAFVTEWTRRSMTLPGVVYRPLLGPTSQIGLEVLWRRDDHSALVQAFLQIVREVRAQQERDRSIVV